MSQPRNPLPQCEESIDGLSTKNVNANFLRMIGTRYPCKRKRRVSQSSPKETRKCSNKSLVEYVIWKTHFWPFCSVSETWVDHHLCSLEWDWPSLDGETCSVSFAPFALVYWLLFLFMIILWILLLREQGNTPFSRRNMSPDAMLNV